MSGPDQAARVRALNDTFRRTFAGGDVLLTEGVMGLGPEAVTHILAEVRKFETFRPDNDPYGEHDFGVFSQAGERLFWKIDCYDLGREFGSSDPTDPRVTTRVLTVMLADEY